MRCKKCDRLRSRLENHLAEHEALAMLEPEAIDAALARLPTLVLTPRLAEIAKHAGVLSHLLERGAKIGC